MKRYLIYVTVIMLLAVLGTEGTAQQTETNIYSVESIPLPDEAVLEVGGMTFNDNRNLAVTTRRGELWIVKNPSSSDPSFQKFAEGLHEPLGLNFKDGAYYLTQRGELSKLRDTNNDGTADVYETIYEWPLDGNYHEYSYGPRFLPNGDMLVTLNLGWIGQGASLSKWRGWLVRITPEGELTPFATGLRSPLGFNFNTEGDVFYAENQGDWIGSGWIMHLEKGDFAGNPEGLKWTGLPQSPLDLTYDDIAGSHAETMYKEAQQTPQLKLPTVWIPHAVFGISTSGILPVTSNDQIGPFKGQLLVADQGYSRVNRVALEKVKGEYQGAVFGLREGFSSGITRIVWGPDNTLYAGMTERGWNSLGPEPYGIDRMKWNGTTPFEIHSIHARADGFLLNFTRPVDKELAAETDSYSITDFTYLYHSNYGSPIVKKESRTITDVEVAEDGKSARLYVRGMRPGFIYEIRAGGIVEDGSNQGLLHPIGYYTLNYLPEGERLAEVEDATGPESQESGNRAVSTSQKMMTEMPDNWTNGPDVTMELGTKPGLRYNKKELTVKAGSKVALTFKNTDDMLHNVVFVEPNSADEVGKEAMTMGLAGPDKEYVPESGKVLYHTPLVNPGDEVTIYFEVPEEPGEYQYVCTYPGHYITMRGVLKVTG